MQVRTTTAILSLFVSLTTVAAAQTDEMEISSHVLQRQTPLFGDVAKRQTDSELCTDPVALERRLASQRCDPSYVAEIQEALGKGCDLFGLRFLFLSLEDQVSRCGKDENGTFCAFHNPSLDQDVEGIKTVDDMTEEVHRRCLEAQSLSETLKNCSTDCRSALEEFSSRFGCCIHVGGLSNGESRKIFTPLLWSRCGVTRPDPCPNAPTLPDSQADVTCSLQCALTQAFAIECKHIDRTHFQILEGCGAGNNLTSLEIRQRCGFNARGDYCGLLTFNFPREYTFSVYSKCYHFYTSNECSMECKAALEEMVDIYGCCLNAMNTTSIEDDIQHLVTRYDLWSACDVETPGFCSFPADLSVYDDLRDCDTCIEN